LKPKLFLTRASYYNLQRGYQMPANAKSLGIDRLSLAERILLVEEIWDGIADEADAIEVPQSHKDELDRRIAEHAADPNSGASWEHVKNQLDK
jgi:putative addiction module component (TIGR02574 family)